METLFPYVFIGGLALLAIGFLALVVVAFRTRTRWGLAVLLFPPTAIIFGAGNWKVSRWPIFIMAIGLVISAFPPVYQLLVPVDLGPRERIVDGESHITLTGWDQKDYSLLKSRSNVKVLQMANPDVNDSTISNLKGMKQLRELDLNDTEVTDNALLILKDLHALESLRLRRTKVTDQGFNDLIAPLLGLNQLDLRETSVTAESAKAWKDAKPGRKVMR